MKNISQRSETGSQDQSIGELLRMFYLANDLGSDGGESERWAKVKMGWMNFYIPNTNSRQRALFFHDVHHLATSYQTDLRGEAEIAAWEIASSCRDYWAAWVLNFFGFCMGLLLSPFRTFKAFVRGRQSRNLYFGFMERDAVSASTVDQIRTQIGVDKEPQPFGMSDVVLFAIWCLPSLLTLVAVTSALVIWIL